MGTRFRARGMLMCVCATAITYAALGRRDEDLLQMVCEESGYKSKVRLHAPCRPDSQLILVRRMITYCMVEETSRTVSENAYNNACAPVQWSKKEVTLKMMQVDHNIPQFLLHSLVC